MSREEDRHHGCIPIPVDHIVLAVLYCSVNCTLLVEHIVLVDGDDGHGVTRVGAVLIQNFMKQTDVSVSGIIVAILLLQ